MNRSRKPVSVLVSAMILFLAVAWPHGDARAGTGTWPSQRFGVGGASLLAPAALAPASIEAAYGDEDAQNAMDQAYALSVLEANGQYNALYDLIHPDAHAVVPRAAVVGWYQNEFGPRGASASVVTGVRFVSWTWAVTGVTYPRTAEVSFTQEFWDGGARTVVDDVVRLVQDRYGTWRWFFGRNVEFVQEQIALYVQPTPRGSLTEVAVADIGAFWEWVFASARLGYVPPEVVTYRAATDTACGYAQGGPPAYCPLGRTIYIDLGWQVDAVAALGDFAWVTSLAREWGRHVQWQLYENGVPNEFVGNPLTEEMQIDCLAGVYARDAETRGVLATGDLTEGVVMAAYGAVGGGLSSDDRVSAFMLGYLAGLVGCGVRI
jgi:Putative neutral zinc metallopeptidase